MTNSDSQVQNNPGFGVRIFTNPSPTATLVDDAQKLGTAYVNMSNGPSQNGSSSGGGGGGGGGCIEE